MVNTFGVHVLRYLNNSSITLHSLGVFSLCVAVLAKAPKHQSAKFVFASFHDGTAVGDAEGWSVRASPVYVALLGILMSQYTMTGFDASAHLSEETINASWSAPIGVLMSIGCSAVFGWLVIVAFLFSIQNFDRTFSSPYDQPVLQILIDVFGDTGAIVLFTLIIVCVWHCGLFSMTSNSRMMYAFSRDGALPEFFHSVDKRFRSPVRTVWLAASLAFLLAIPSLGSTVAFQAATSIATIGLYISYGLPILIGMVNPAGFIHGPFNLRKFSRPVALVACLYIAFITVVFCLPQLNPVNSQTLNYTPVAVGIVLLWCVLSWFLWAHRWFRGPIRQIELEMAGVNVDDPEAMDRAEKEGRVPQLDAARASISGEGEGEVQGEGEGEGEGGGEGEGVGHAAHHPEPKSILAELKHEYN